MRREKPIGVAGQLSYVLGLLHYVCVGIRKRVRRLVLAFEEIRGPKTPNECADRFSIIAGEVLPSIQRQIELLIPTCIKNHIREHLGGTASAQAKTIVEEAEEICRHQVMLFGAKYSLGTEIHWHRDPQSGYEWPLDPSAEIPIIRHHDCSDIKYVWELNRFAHAVRLGQAYCLIADEKYATEFARQVRSWIAMNPLGKGANWTCTMEVALRAIALVWAYSLMRESPAMDRGFVEELLGLLVLHGIHIQRNLENLSPNRGNHYIANLLGLAYLGFIFEALPLGRRWRALSVRQLRREMNRQVLPDGTFFEGSIPYHRLATEMMFHMAFLTSIAEGRRDEEVDVAHQTRRCARVLGKRFVDRLEDMFSFICTYVDSRGLAPQIGDNDSGRVLPFERPGTDTNDHRATLALGAAFFGREDFYRSSSPADEYAQWLYGRRSGIQSNQSCTVSSRGFVDSGFFIMRSQTGRLALRCGRLGTNGKGTHTHNDNLGFDLSISGIPFIVDPGTCTYSGRPPLRNAFRSGKKHNAPVVDNLEQNGIECTDLFSLKATSKANTVTWSTTASLDRFIGEISYQGATAALSHRRQFCFNKAENTIRISDDISGRGSHQLAWSFHAGANIAVTDRGDSVVLSHSSGTSLTMRFCFPCGFSITTCNGSISPGYGQLIDSQTCLILAECVLPSTFSFLLAWN